MGRKQAELTKVAFIRKPNTEAERHIHWPATHRLISMNLCCAVSSRLWMYEEWLIQPTVMTLSAFKTLDEMNLAVHRQSSDTFSCYSVLSVLYLHHHIVLTCSWLSATDQSLLLFEDILTKRVTLLHCGCLETRKVSRCSPSKMTDSERLHIRAFSFSKLANFLLNSTERVLP